MSVPVLILESDKPTCEAYRSILGEKFDLRFVDTIASLRQALAGEEAMSGGPKPALIIADIEVSDGRIVDFLIEETSRPRNLPVMIVSAIDEPEALRTCFDSGALDYLTKPFTSSELMIKVERAIDRSKVALPAADFSHGIRLEPTALRVSRNGKSAQLTAREIQIFSVLIRGGVGPVRRQEIRGEVWPATKVGDKTLDVHLFNLRRKLAPLGIGIAFRQPDQYLIACGSRSSRWRAR